MYYIKKIPYNWRPLFYWIFVSLFLWFISGWRIAGAVFVVNMGIYTALLCGMETIMQFIKTHLSEQGKDLVENRLINRVLISEKDIMFLFGPLLGFGFLFGIFVDNMHFLIVILLELVLIFFMIRDLLYYYLYK